MNDLFPMIFALKESLYLQKCGHQMEKNDKTKQLYTTGEQAQLFYEKRLQTLLNRGYKI